MDIHKRKCWSCKNIAEHKDSIVPEVLCKLCGSQDTRRIRTEPKHESIQVTCLAVVPMSEADVTEAYHLSGHADYNWLRTTMQALCLSHERLRAELAGAESMLNFDAEPAVVHTTAKCKTCNEFYGYHFPCRCGNHL